MPATAAPFPHLDAIQALYDRAAGRGSVAAADPVGPSLFPGPFVTVSVTVAPGLAVVGLAVSVGPLLAAAVAKLKSPESARLPAASCERTR